MWCRVQPVVLLAAAVLVLTACDSRQVATPPTGDRPASTPLQAGAPTTRATPPPTEPLPVPVPIPPDSYAPEAVVAVGSIEIPAIGLEHMLFRGVTLHNIDRGPSHWPGTAEPGERGNTVVAGHRATHSQPFRRIHELRPGDEVVFRVSGRRSVYQVTSHLVVTPEDTWIAGQSREFTATLYACHPPGSDEYRYVVRLALASTGPDL